MRQSKHAEISPAQLRKTAFKAAAELKDHINGTHKLEDLDVEARKEVIKQACKGSLYFFAKVILGFDKLTKRTHKRWAEDLQENFFKVDYLMRLKPRSTFKTTLYGEAFMLWLWACVSPKLRIFYTSASGALISEVSAHIDRFIGLETDSLYAFVFGIKRDKSAAKNTNSEINILGRDKDAKGHSLIFRTAGGSTNGVHPHVIIIDDPSDQKDRTSAATRKQKEIWFDSLNALIVSLTVGELKIQKIMFIGTRWHMKDLAHYVMTKNDFYQVEVESVYTKNGLPAYPEFFDKNRIEMIKATISSIFFSSQYLNDPMPEGEQIFEVDRLHFFDIEFLNLSVGTNYCFFDPSQGKQGSDFPAVVWFNLYDGNMCLFDAVDKKIPLASMISIIAKKNVEHCVRGLIYETNGTTLLTENFTNAHKELKYQIFIEAIHETRNKVERIYTIQPEIYNGRVKFRKDYKKHYPELMNQLLFFPVWGHDDYPDIIEKAITYLIQKTPGKFLKGGSKGTLSGSVGTLAGSLKVANSW